MPKCDVRKKCRERWGPQWWKVNPLLKKARMQWALDHKYWDTVCVTEADGSSYVV